MKVQAAALDSNTYLSCYNTKLGVRLLSLNLKAAQHQNIEATDRARGEAKPFVLNWHPHNFLIGLDYLVAHRNHGFQLDFR